MRTIYKHNTATGVSHVNSFVNKQLQKLPKLLFKILNYQSK